MAEDIPHTSFNNKQNMKETINWLNAGEPVHQITSEE